MLLLHILHIHNMLCLIFCLLRMCFTSVKTHSELPRRQKSNIWPGLYGQCMEAYCQHTSMHVVKVLLLDILHIHTVQLGTFTTYSCSIFCTFTIYVAWYFARYMCVSLVWRYIMNVLQDNKSNIYAGYRLNVYKHIGNMLVFTLWTRLCLTFCKFSTCN